MPERESETVLVRAGVTREVHRRLKHLAADLRLPLAAVAAKVLTAAVGLGEAPQPDPERAYGNSPPTE